MPKEKEQNQRVAFEHALPAHLMAIDGTWRRTCYLKEVSEGGAKVQTTASLEGLGLDEFFLLLSSTGLVYRRCRLDRVNGDELEISFLRQTKRKNGAKEPSDFV